MQQTIASPRLGYPRVSTVSAFYENGARFHVMNGAEAFRVERFGGEEEFTRLMLSELRSDDVFFDIGSCIGFVAVHTALLGARTVAFEPEPSFRERLIANLELNSLESRVQVIPWAVSDREGTVKLFTDGAGGTSPSLVQTGERNAIEIPTDTIDRAIASGTLPVPTVMKIDVEGAETLALQGMRDVLNGPHAPRIIFIELHPKFLPGFDSSVEEAAGLIESAGYKSDYEESRYDQILRLYRRTRNS